MEINSNIEIIDLINYDESYLKMAVLKDSLKYKGIPHMLKLMINGYSENSYIDYDRYIIIDKDYFTGEICEYHLNIYQFKSIIDYLYSSTKNFFTHFEYDGYELLIKNNLMLYEKRNYGDSPVYNKNKDELYMD